MFYAYAAYALIMNLLAFLLMAIDKGLAKKRCRRIPEKVLFGAALLGGSFGGVLAMQLFRHKTKHLSFRIIFPSLLILHALLSWALIRFGIIPLP